jgi:hypothetical protein
MTKEEESEITKGEEKERREWMAERGGEREERMDGRKGRRKRGENGWQKGEEKETS